MTKKARSHRSKPKENALRSLLSMMAVSDAERYAQARAVNKLRVESGKAPPLPPRAPKKKSALRSYKKRGGVAKALVSPKIDVTLSGPKTTNEDITVAVNPFLLSQFVFGVTARVLQVSDSQVHYQQVLDMVYYFMQNIKDPGNIPVPSWPRAIIEVAMSLRSNKYGGFNFTTDWRGVDAWLNDVIARGYATSNLGDTAPSYLTAGANNIWVGTNYVPVAATVNGVQLWLSQYARELDVVPILPLATTHDPSAFAYDIGGMKVAADFPGNSLQTVVASGIIGASTPAYLPLVSTVGLEVPIKTRWMASLRLGTYWARVGVAPQFVNVTANARRAQYYFDVVSPPATIGAAYDTKKRMLRRVMLKVCPGFTIMAAAQEKLEAMINTMDAASKAKVLAALGINDLPMIVYIWYKNFLSKFAGYAVGTYGMASGNINVSSEAYYAHFGMAVFKEARIPQEVQRLFMSQNVYSQGGETIIPLINTLNPQGLTILLGLTYTGTSTYTTINTAGLNGGVSAANALLAKWKGIESLFAETCNLDHSSTEYCSHLDATFIQQGTGSTGTTQAIGIRSRVPITDPYFTEILLHSPAISYDNGPGVQSSDVTDNLQPYNVGSHEFRQQYHRELSGQDSLQAMWQSVTFDGLVQPGTQSSNATGNSNIPNSGGVEWEENTLPHNYAEVENPKQASIIEKMAKRLIPRNGKYCGPGWTAGVDTFDKETFTIDGKYVASPTSLEDAICKRHDEAYRRADGATDLVKMADRDMVRELDELNAKKGLSLYGRAAKLAIATKLLLG